ncbi:uncharacterized protein C8A04DRAFT_28105 [Dichotomopilus funicola]|uniref:Cell wall protein n=1 Tax=Dichotomopilus funicola TaxID=1934379 RepID=A0AAN6ZNA4_9PEZI|nr:hypothetical protein C8A04DRAFT_28105 [Dichotomopilus funicola]
MQLTTFTILAGAAVASVSAAVLAPEPEPAPEPAFQKFSLTAVLEDAPFNNGSISASKGKLWLLLPANKEDAQCDGEYQRTTFFVDAEQLLLYHGDFDSHQRIFANSPTYGGWGSLDYFNNSDGETRDWQVQDSRLSFNDQDWVACSEDDGSYSVFVDAGQRITGGGRLCVPFQAAVVNETEPVSCEYTVQ